MNVCDSLSLHWALWTTSTSKHATEWTATTAKELCEQVFSSHAASGTALLKPFFAILVIYAALLRIAQNFICVCEFFEFDLGLGLF
jgi:hypothetical protein